MSTVEDDFRTVEEFDAEIRALTEERDRRVALVENPEEREARRLRRELLVGIWWVQTGMTLAPEQVKSVCGLSGGDAWIWNEDVLKADGWVQDRQGWRLKREAADG